MPRIARLVIPGVPHHITQRGNRGETVFFTDDDRRWYLHLLGQYAAKNGLLIYAYCLMTNHVHLIAVPERPDSLASTLRPLHLRHTQHVNRNQRMSGILWRGRPYSCPMDERHTWEAIRYVERNPVRAGLILRADRYMWSSAPGHCGLKKDPLLAGDLEQRGVVEDWVRWLQQGEDEAVMKTLRRNTRTGRPVGDEEFVARIESLSGRLLHPRHAGRPKKSQAAPAAADIEHPAPK